MKTPVNSVKAFIDTNTPAPAEVCRFYSGNDLGDLAIEIAQNGEPSVKVTVKIGNSNLAIDNSVAYMT